MIRADGNGQQREAEVREDLAEDDLADDDGGKADDNGAAAHVDVARALILRQQRAGEATRPFETIRPSTIFEFVLMPCARAMWGVCAGRAQRAALLRAEEPVQDGDDRGCEEKQQRQGIVHRELAHVALRNSSGYLQR